MALSPDDPSLVLAKYHPRLQRCSRATVYRWLMTGQLEAVRVGCRWFTTDAAVQRFFDRCNLVNPTFTIKPEAKSERLRKAMDEFGLKGGGQ